MTDADRPSRILVIADDLSGAAEIGGICHRLDRPATILRDRFDEVSGALAPDGAGAVILDTDSRSLPPEEARCAVERALRSARNGRFDLIYKKIDSALRGPVAAEAEAARAMLGRSAALVLPQNPSRGRTIGRDGVYRIDGTPIDQTLFAQDPEHPAFTSAALARLQASAQTPPAALVAPGGGFPESGLFLASAETPADVEAWTDAVSPEILPVGGADFFLALLRRHPTAGAAPGERWEASATGKSPPAAPSCPRGETLFVNGSAAHGGAGLRASSVPLCPMPDDRSADAWADAVLAALSRHGRAAMTVDVPPDRSPGAPRTIERVVAETVAVVLARRQEVAHLLVAGGATASSAVRRLGFRRFQVAHEWSPGVVAVTTESDLPAAALAADPPGWITIKPGSYPWPSAVLKGW